MPASEVPPTLCYGRLLFCTHNLTAATRLREQMNSKRERPKVPLRGTKRHKKIIVTSVPIGGKPHPGFAVGPAEHCQPLRAQNLPALLLWGGDSTAVISCTTRGHGESAPPRRSRDRLRNLFPDSLLVC